MNMKHSNCVVYTDPFHLISDLITFCKAISLLTTLNALQVCYNYFFNKTQGFDCVCELVWICVWCMIYGVYGKQVGSDLTTVP